MSADVLRLNIFTLIIFAASYWDFVLKFRHIANTRTVVANAKKTAQP